MALQLLWLGHKKSMKVVVLQLVVAFMIVITDPDGPFFTCGEHEGYGRYSAGDGLRTSS